MLITYGCICHGNQNQNNLPIDRLSAHTTNQGVVAFTINHERMGVVDSERHDLPHPELESEHED